MKKCILVPDSFKGTISSVEVCNIISQEIQQLFPACEVVAIPVADGGEGTVDCFLHAVPQARRVEAVVSGPYGEQCHSFYGRFDDCAVIEMAAAAGLPMVQGRKNPAKTTTYGVGQLIAHALAGGAKRIILGLGGSCTNDGGCGCAAALGVLFYNAHGQTFVPTGETLADIAHIDTAPARRLLQGCSLTAMCDITNPLHGPNGAAYIYAPQKGADPETVAMLDTQLQTLETTIASSLGLQEIGRQPGAGAAGGFGAGVVAFLGGRLQPGIETVLELLSFDNIAAGADAIFTGEGRLDAQSLAGKVVVGVGRRGKTLGIPVYAIVGDVAEDVAAVYQQGVTAVFSTNRRAVPIEIANTTSKADLAAAAQDVLRLIKSLTKQ